MMYFTAIEGRRHHFCETYQEHRRVSDIYRKYYEALKLGDKDPDRFLPPAQERAKYGLPTPASG